MSVAREAYIKSLKTSNNNRTEFLFDKNKISLQELNNLRRFLFQKYTTSAIMLLVGKNSSSTHDETYLSLFSQVLIDDSEWNNEIINYMDEEYLGTFTISVNGDRMIYPTDIKSNVNTNGLKIVSDSEGPIMWLRDNENIDFALYIKRGTGTDDAIFYPHTVTYIVPANEEKYHKLIIESKYDHISPKKILTETIKGLEAIK